MLFRQASAEALPRRNWGRRNPGIYQVVEQQAPRASPLDRHNQGSVFSSERPSLFTYGLDIDGAESKR